MQYAAILNGTRVSETRIQPKLKFQKQTNLQNSFIGVLLSLNFSKIMLSGKFASHRICSPQGLFNVCIWLVLVQWENFIYDICFLCWAFVILFGIYTCNSCDLIIGLDWTWPHMGWWLGQLLMRSGLFVEVLSCPPFVGTVKPEPNTISLSLHVIPMGLALA